LTGCRHSRDPRQARLQGRRHGGKQRKDEVRTDVNDLAVGRQGHDPVQRAVKWIWSGDIAHPAIIDDDAFRRPRSLLAGPPRRTA
jgi:hypothetical protein